MKNSQQDSFNFICCGSVDDGKSSLIGQILLNTNSVKKDVFDEAQNVSFDNGNEFFEPSLLLDGLLDERSQQITIDIAHRYFDYKNTRYHIFDCPGHEQYTKNMAIAAAEANCAILTVDVSKGVSKQTEKHISICALFQIKYLIVVLSKCDLLSWDEKAINKRKKEIKSLLNHYNFDYSVVCVDSIRAKNIDKVLTEIEKYKNKYYKERKENTVIHVYNCRFYHQKRYIYGKVLGALSLKKGEKLKLFPNNIDVTIQKNPIAGIFQIKEDIDIQNGDVISSSNLICNNVIKHNTFWFYEPTNDMLFRHGTTYTHIEKYTDSVITLNKAICFSNINEVKENGFGIIIDNKTKRTLGVSVFLANDKLNKNTNKGHVYWFTGLSGSGKTTMALTLKDYFSIKPILLDADEVRKTINNDLGYSKEDCLKNVARISQMAKLLSEQGFDVIVTCISKYKSQRREIKKYIGEQYVEILMDRNFDVLKKNDVKGLYHSLGTKNIIKDYEYGNSANIVIDVDKTTEEENKEYLITKLKEIGVLL